MIQLHWAIVLALLSAAAAFAAGFYCGCSSRPVSEPPKQRLTKPTIDDADQDGFVGTRKVDDSEQ